VLHSIKVRLYRRFIGRNKDRNKALFWQKRKVKSAKWKRSLLNLLCTIVHRAVKMFTLYHCYHYCHCHYFNLSYFLAADSAWENGSFTLPLYLSSVATEQMNWAPWGTVRVILVNRSMPWRTQRENSFSALPAWRIRSVLGTLPVHTYAHRWSFRWVKSFSLSLTILNCHTYHGHMHWTFCKRGH